jgi:hypothetical protein
VKGREYEEGTFDSRRVCFVCLFVLFFFFVAEVAVAVGVSSQWGFFFYFSCASFVRNLLPGFTGSSCVVGRIREEGKRKGSGGRARSFL